MNSSIIKNTFPSISDQKLIDFIVENGIVHHVKAGEKIIDFGSYIKMIPLVFEGSIKVLREDKSGGELFLYFLNPGQTCALTLQCCQVAKKSEVRAVAEEDTSFIAIPINLIERLNIEFKQWNEFVLQTYNDRFYELLNTLDGIVFQKLDERLLEYLKKKSEIIKSKVVEISHQEIANDLHSTREVISRILKQFEKKGQVKLGRGKIAVM